MKVEKRAHAGPVVKRRFGCEKEIEKRWKHAGATQIREHVQLWPKTRRPYRVELPHWLARGQPKWAIIRRIVFKKPAKGIQKKKTGQKQIVFLFSSPKTLLKHRF